uniref:Uncharacterized protein n=1 Tax=Seriola dumerili TaxID=41447 RepID=A0A3B4VA54_SERDU
IPSNKKQASGLNRCSLYLFSCTIQGNIFINYFLNTGFLVSIWRREFHHIPQFCIAINIAVIVVTVSGFHFNFKWTKEIICSSLHHLVKFK